MPNAVIEKLIALLQSDTDYLGWGLTGGPNLEEINGLSFTRYEFEYVGRGMEDEIASILKLSKVINVVTGAGGNDGYVQGTMLFTHKKNIIGFIDWYYPPYCDDECDGSATVYLAVASSEAELTAAYEAKQADLAAEAITGLMGAFTYDIAHAIKLNPEGGAKAIARLVSNLFPLGDPMRGRLQQTLIGAINTQVFEDQIKTLADAMPNVKQIKFNIESEFNDEGGYDPYVNEILIIDNKGKAYDLPPNSYDVLEFVVEEYTDLDDNPFESEKEAAKYLSTITGAKASINWDDLVGNIVEACLSAPYGIHGQLTLRA